MKILKSSKNAVDLTVYKSALKDKAITRFQINNNEMKELSINEAIQVVKETLENKLYTESGVYSLSLSLSVNSEQWINDDVCNDCGETLIPKHNCINQ